MSRSDKLAKEMGISPSAVRALGVGPATSMATLQEKGFDNTVKGRKPESEIIAEKLGLSPSEVRALGISYAAALCT